MISLLDEMPRVKAIIDSADKEELNKYCDSHDGFYGSVASANRARAKLAKVRF